MELTILGSGSCAPNPERSPACYFLSIGPTRIILDPGPGGLDRIIRAGIDPFDIEAIFISHYHVDHCADVIPYLFWRKNCLGKHDGQDVHIVAPEGYREIFENLKKAWGKWIISDSYDIVIDEVREDMWEAPGVDIRCAPMLHGANAVGYRFEKKGGAALAYSGDTGFCRELIELASDADLLLVECSFPDNVNVEGHMRPTEVARAGMESGAKKLVLTHFYPSVDTADAIKTIRDAGYEGGIIAGHDGMRITI